MIEGRIEYRVYDNEIRYGTYNWQFRGSLGKAETKEDAVHIVCELNSLQQRLDQDKP